MTESGVTSGRLPHAVAAEELTEVFTGALTGTMRALLRELREVFETETLNLEKRLSHPSRPLLPPSEHRRSIPIEAASPATVRTESSESVASVDGAEAPPVPNKRRRQLKRGLHIEALERSMMESALDAKFGKARGDEQAPCVPNPHPSPSPSLVPFSNFESPVPGFGQDDLSISRTCSTMSRVPSIRACVFTTVPLFTARLCGVLPWHRNWPCLSVAYQRFLLLVLCYCLVVEGFFLVETNSFVEITDLCLAIGAFFALVGCGALWRSSGLMDCADRLDAYMQEYNCQYLVDRTSCMDTSGSFLVLAFLVAFRAGMKGDFDCSDGIFAFAACVICGTACYLVRMCTIVSWLIDSYCAQMVFKDTYADAVKEWYLLDSLCRMVCSTIQWSFISLQLTSMALIIFLFVLGMETGHALHSCLPIVLCALGMMRLVFFAAIVSEKCRRVPRLFTNAGNGKFDASRALVVEYIHHCQSGLELLGMRIDFALILKLIYGICAASFTLLSRAVLQP